LATKNPNWKGKSTIYASRNLGGKGAVKENAATRGGVREEKKSRLLPARAFARWKKETAGRGKQNENEGGGI